MKIEISRSFSKKTQVKQFEPAEWFCAAKMEIELDGKTEKANGEKMKELSEKLNQFCVDEVEEAEQVYMTPIEKVGKFDENAPAKINVKPWDYKKDFGKMYGPGIKNKDIAETEKQAAELSTEAELES